MDRWDEVSFMAYIIMGQHSLARSYSLRLDGWNKWTADGSDSLMAYAGLFRSALRRLFGENLFTSHMTSNTFTQSPSV